MYTFHNKKTHIWGPGLEDVKNTLIIVEFASFEWKYGQMGTGKIISL